MWYSQEMGNYSVLKKKKKESTIKPLKDIEEICKYINK